VNNTRGWTILVVLGLAVGLCANATAQQRDCDFDWMMSTVDVLLNDLLGTFDYPLAQQDNDSDGIWEEDSLGMLGSVLRGDTRVSGLPSGDVSQIQSDFAYNRNAADWDMRIEGDGATEPCGLVKLALGVDDCRLTTLLKSDMVDLGPAAVMLERILLDFMGGLCTIANNTTPGTFTFINNFLDALVDALLDPNVIDPTIIEAIDDYVGIGTLKSDLHLQAGNYRRWGNNPSASPRRNAFGGTGGSGNMDLDGATNWTEYVAAGYNREAYLTSNTITPAIHITGQPVGGSFSAGDEHPMTVTFAGGTAPFTFIWEDAQDFPGDDGTYGLVRINDGNGISGSASQTLSFDYLLPAHDGLRPWVRISDPVTIHNPVTPAGGAVAPCNEPDGFGGRTSVFSEILVSPRTFQISPQPVPSSTTLNVGAPYSLTSGAVGGNSVPSYQWQRNTVSMMGQTNKTFSIPSVIVGDAGTYRMRATNADKATLYSNNCVLVVNVPLSITQDPVGANKAVGDDHTFTVGIADGVAPFTYTWRRTGIIVGIDGPTSNTTSSLVLNGLFATDQGSYNCTVTDSATGNAVSASTDLTVLAISQQPSNQEVQSGGSASFEVVVLPGSGLPGYNYQWWHDGLSISGATNSTYAIPSAGPSDEGTYYCVVGDSGGASLQSASATLTISSSPIYIGIQPVGGKKYADDDHTFMITASGGFGTLTYQWCKDGTTSGHYIPGATNSSYTISPLAAGDDGQYKCLVGDDLRPPAAFAESNWATLEVRNRMQVSVQPLGNNLVTGDNHTFNVTVTGGYTPYSYQWRKTGAAEGPNAASYPLTNLTYDGDQGTYDCVIDDDHTDQVITNGATLTVVEIQTQPQSVEVATGQNATFDITVRAGSGVPGYTYQWYFGGAPIANATLEVYTRTNCQSSDEGNYTCEVTDSALAALMSGPATLTVTANPIDIDVQPQDADMYEGDNYTFTCEASGGSGTLTYRWSKDSVIIPGANSSSLALTGLVAGDAGDYQCLVGDDYRPPAPYAESDIATLQVEPRVSISVQPVGGNKAVGDSHQFSVTASGGYAPLSYEWLRDELGAPPGSGVSVYTGGATYDIPSLLAINQGGHSVIVSDDNTDSETSSGADLTVLAIDTQPLSQNVAESTPVTFTVVVLADSGVAPYTYQWQYRGVDMPGETGSSCTVTASAGSPDGNPPPVNPTGTEGDYTCVVTDNAAASLVSSAATLSVSANPIVFNVPPVGGAKYVGESHTFNVTASGGVGTLTYQWTKDGTTPAHYIPDATTSSLTLNALELTDAGDYRVLVGDNTRPPDPFAESPVATLLVGTPLSIDGQPEHGDLYVGETYNTAVVVSGGVGALSFQWYTAVPVAAIPGATESSLSIPNVQLSDIDGYRCYVEDAKASPLGSSWAYLQVSQPISITAEPASQTVDEGDPAAFSISATGGKRGLHYAWTKDGVPVGWDSPSYPLPPVSLEDAGRYECTVTDSGSPPGSTASDAAFLTVTVYFEIYEQPEDVQAYWYSLVYFQVGMRYNSGAVSYQWYLDTDPGSKAPVAIPEGTTLRYTVDSVGTEDVGEYFCEVTDDKATPDPGDDETLTSGSAVLVATDHLGITAQPQGAERYTGQSHTFSVLAEGGFQPLAYQWRKNEIDVPDATESTYQIYPLQEEDSGEYKVEVSDAKVSGGDVIQSDPATLTVSAVGAPVAGLAGLGLLLGACILGGAYAMRRKH